MADFITQFTAEEYVNRDNFNSRITQANTGLATVQSAAAAAQQTANGKAPVSHTHAAVDITSGILPIARGGTGATTAAAARTALGITPANIGAGTQSAVEAAQTTADNAASAAAAAQQTANGKAPVSHTHAVVDITSGTLPIARGGTGQTTVAGVRNALGLGNTTGALPIANGGTGATTAAAARTALEITPANIGAGTQSAVEAAQTTADNAASAAAAAQTTANGKANASHTHAASQVAGGPLAGKVLANDTSTADLGAPQVRNIIAGTGALTVGVSAIQTGMIYFQYE